MLSEQRLPHQFLARCFSIQWSRAVLTVFLHFVPLTPANPDIGHLLQSLASLMHQTFEPDTSVLGLPLANPYINYLY